MAPAMKNGQHDDMILMREIIHRIGEAYQKCAAYASMNERARQ